MPGGGWWKGGKGARRWIALWRGRRWCVSKVREECDVVIVDCAEVSEGGYDNGLEFVDV